MKNLILISLLSLTANSFAKEFALDTGEKIIKYNIVKVNNISVDDKCAKDIQKCMAYKAVKKKAKIPAKSETATLIGHPASKKCLNKGGAPLVLTDKLNNEYDFCIFKDKTLVNSWDIK